ncbi:hypothetical protein CON53_27990, partial [Bacillus cereus]
FTESKLLPKSLLSFPLKHSLSSNFIDIIKTDKKYTFKSLKIKGLIDSYKKPGILPESNL